MMTHQSDKTKRAFLLVILVCTVFPFFQGQFNLIELTPLKGAWSVSVNRKFTFKDWFSGNYQSEKEIYLNENFGFRSFFIRVNNQLAYSLIKKAKASDVIIGKKNFLFEKNYINAYYGDDFIGYDSVKHRIFRFKYIEDTLKKLHKNMLFVIGPGKGSFYPEYIPEKYKSVRKPTNYQTHIDWARHFGVSYIDFNRYFLESKAASPYPLYPQYGIHWSYYGMCMVADSIIRYIEKVRNIDMPNLYWTKIVQKQPNENDYDVADGMNLLFKLRSFEMAYPQFQIQTDSNLVKPTVLVIADSFYWGIFNFGLSNAFSNSHFWYYNRQIYPDSYQSALETSQINLGSEIARHDVIIILASEANLSDFGWGFIENAFAHFKRESREH